MKTVTLDALIEREDFDVLTSPGSVENTRNKSTLSIEDLKYDSFFSPILRKPIFQRETNEWDTNKVVGLIESFIKGELIPAIILWKSKSGYVFVIDGAHRLSSLSAWINDDYGDGEISKKYYNNFISQEQRDIAEKTRELINNKVGSFKDLLKITRNVDLAKNKEQKEYAKSLGSLALQLQWVDGDADKAEDSFFKINQSATKISDAELELIQFRNKSYAVAARAIVRAGKGYKYWADFSEEGNKTVEHLSQNIYNILFGKEGFNPNDINTFSIGGIQSSNFTLDVVTQTVKICNDINDKNDFVDKLESEVIKYLKKVLNILQYINSTEKFSLGIHPFIYFYSDLGKHKIGSYYGFLLFIKLIIEQKRLNDFTRIRGTFEDFIYQYSFLIQQIVRKYRQSKKAYEHISKFYKCIMDLLIENNNLDIAQIAKEIIKNEEFMYLKVDLVDNEEVQIKGNFSRGKKQQIKLKTFVKSIPRCPICNGYLSTKSTSVDHIQRKRDGGDNSIDNGQLTHIYCNTTYKN